MDTPFETVIVSSRVLTGLVILLNFNCLLSIYLLTRWLRHPEEATSSRVHRPGEDYPSGGLGAVLNGRAKAAVCTLLVLVVAVNLGAVTAHFRLVDGIRRVAAVVPRSAKIGCKGQRFDCRT